MNRDYLTAEQVKSMLIAVSEAVVAAKDQLADADRAIGDGDHGIGMANGFSAAKEKLEAAEPQDVYALFALTGQTLIRVMGALRGLSSDPCSGQVPRVKSRRPPYRPRSSQGFSRRAWRT